MQSDTASLWGGDWAARKQANIFSQTVYVVKKISPPTTPRYRSQHKNHCSVRKGAEKINDARDEVRFKHLPPRFSENTCYVCAGVTGAQRMATAKPAYF